MTAVPQSPLVRGKRVKSAKIPSAIPSRFGMLTILRSAAEIIREIELKHGLTAYQAEKLVEQNAEDIVFGPYVLQDELGSGSCGTCFIASRIATGEIVSLRLLPNDYGKRELAWIRSALQASKKIQSDRFQRPTEAGFDKGRCFVTSKLIVGEDLHRLVKRHGPLTINQALYCIARVVETLEIGLQAGLVHQELRPSKIIVDRQGGLAIRDLAIAQVIQRRKRAAADLHTLFRVTPRHHFNFIAPELLLDDVEENMSADIYSLGCILFFLITGQAMYVGKDPLRTVIAHRETEIPSLASRIKGAPPIVDACLSKMVAKLPKDRFQNYAQCHAALRAVAKGLPKLTVPIEEQWKFVDDAVSASVEPRQPIRRISTRRLTFISALSTVLLGCVVGSAIIASTLKLPASDQEVDVLEVNVPEGERAVQSVESEDSFSIP